MHTHESSQGQGPEHGATKLHRQEGGSGKDVTPETALRLQRSAGNGAVAEALAVQRKMFNNVSGDLKGPMKTDKEGVTELNFSDGWISLPDKP